MPTELLRYVEGDATRPQGDGYKFIVHCCNNLGAWGRGFVLAISKRWKAPERYYRALDKYPLGYTHRIVVEQGIDVVNIIGQDGLRKGKDGLPPIRYEALRSGFIQTVRWAKMQNASVHMPRIGSGLAGGDWALIERLIEVTFLQAKIPVTVYDLPGGKFRDSRLDSDF